MDTLAVAHAEAGDFAAAVHWAEEALKHADPEVHPLLRQRLELFRAGLPLRE
jgi:hypothetical protein